MSVIVIIIVCTKPTALDRTCPSNFSSNFLCLILVGSFTEYSTNGIDTRSVTDLEKTKKKKTKLDKKDMMVDNFSE